RGAVRATRAWEPWDSNGWQLETNLVTNSAEALTYAKMAYLLSPFDMTATEVVFDRLLAAGEHEGARHVAIDLESSELAVHHVAGDLLTLRLDASEANFGAALNRARGALEVRASDVGWVKVLRFRIAWRAVELAAILGKAPEVASLVVERYLDREPPA